ncbi:VCBS repeat-containing protein [Akkermansiaceae bacterium]|nr:VCBS repeat-containing protein [Akkermansiaceae bacterium]
MITKMHYYSFFLALLSVSVSHAQKQPAEIGVSFQKIQLLDKYHSEGVSVGDMNADGILDIIAGSIIWEGPDFKEKFAYEPVKYYPIKGKGLTGYASVFFTFADELTNDKWTDIIQLSFQRKPAKLFINPGENPSPADHDAASCEHCIAQENICNESPTYLNIIGDEREELLSYSGNFITLAYPTDDPKAKWNVLELSHNDKKFAKGHGLGAGDINGDGRMDVIDRFGWWEQPKDWDKASEWKFHEVNFTPEKPNQGGAQMFAYDVDGDGDNDVVTALNAHAYGFAWFEQANEGGVISFTPHMIMNKKPSENPYGVAFSQLHSMGAADIDGDGIKDIVTGKCFYAHGGKDPGAEEPAVLYWFRTTRDEKGNVEFVPYLIDSNSGVGRQIATEDVNGDGKIDIVTSNKKGVFVFLQK